MTYLPELRESLVKAAALQGAGAHTEASAPRRPPRRLRRFAGRLAAGVAVAAALLVAGVALVLLASRHSGRRSPSSASPPATQPAQLQAAAARTLAGTPLPTSAIRVNGDESSQRRLASPGDHLALQHVAYAHAYWRVTESPQDMLRFLEARRFAGVSTVATNAGTGKAIQKFTITFPLSAGPTVATELTLDGAPARGGGTAIRADGEAGALVPRPASERIPPELERLLVTPISLPRNRLSRHKPGYTTTIDSPKLIAEIVSLLNSLPLVQPGTRPCSTGRGPEVRVAFEAKVPIRPAKPVVPVAVALIHLSCSTVDFTLAGRRQPPLTWQFPAQVDPRRLTRVLDLLVGR